MLYVNAAISFHNIELITQDHLLPLSMSFSFHFVRSDYLRSLVTFVDAGILVFFLQKAALVNLWWKGFQHTSSSLRSCYGTVTVSDTRWIKE